MSESKIILPTCDDNEDTIPISLSKLKFFKIEECKTNFDKFQWYTRKVSLAISPFTIVAGPVLLSLRGATDCFCFHSGRNALEKSHDKLIK